MSLKPSVACNVLADRATMEKIIGPKLGKRFAPNPAISEYAYVLRFPTSGVVTSREMAHALRKLPADRGAVLVVGQDFTLEARQAAIAVGCDLTSVSEFGWTDASYQARMRG